jgi:hypothetical protein
MIALLPAADNFRFVGFAGWAGCACCFFCVAHLALCAAAILARPALLIVRRLAGAAWSVAVTTVAAATVAFGRPGPRWPSCALMSAILAETRSISLLAI